MRLEVSAQALADLDAMRQYGFEHYEERAADDYLAALTHSLDRIAQWPFAARIRAEIRPPARLAVHGAHNIFYDVEADAVRIVRVRHHTADWRNEP